MARLTGYPVVELNRAVAVAEVAGPEAGLRLLAGLPLEPYRYLHATRAELLRRLDLRAQAGEAYRQALALTDDDVERRFLLRRLDALG